MTAHSVNNITADKLHETSQKSKEDHETNKQDKVKLNSRNTEKVTSTHRQIKNDNANKKISMTTQQLNRRAGKVNRTAPKSKRDKQGKK